MVGSLSTLDVVWTFADIANILMALPNLVALLLLSNVIVKETRRHLGNPPSGGLPAIEQESPPSGGFPVLDEGEERAH